MADDRPMTWSLVAQTLTRPYPVSLPMVVLVLLVPVYLIIPGLTPVRRRYGSTVRWDRVLPLGIAGLGVAGST